MREVEVRALEQNASAFVAQAAAGKQVTITDRGRKVAQVGPIPASQLDQLIAAGRARPGRGALWELAEPESGPEASPVLDQMRDEQRY